MALISPGVQVTVIDESQYTPTAAGSVAYVLLATAQDKSTPSGALAVATTKANAGKLVKIVSQRDLVLNYGSIAFELDEGGNPLNGDERNEYGLLAAYSALGVANQLYVQRADIDLTQLTGTAIRPTGTPSDGTYWLDISASGTNWGIYEWNADGVTFALQTPRVIENADQVSGTTPFSSVGAIGEYAVVTTTTRNPIYYKGWDNNWYLVGSSGDAALSYLGWADVVPAITGSVANPNDLATTQQMVINDVTVSLSGTDVEQTAQDINDAAIDGVSARVNVSGQLEIFVNATGMSDGSVVDGNLTITKGTGGAGDCAVKLGLFTAADGTNSSKTVYGPAVQFSDYRNVPAWRASDDTPRPYGSVWIKNSATGNGANWGIKEYSSNLDSWQLQAAPLYASDLLAIYGLDPIGGGASLAVGTLYVKYDTYGDNTTTFKLYRKNVKGLLKLTGSTPETAFVFTPGDKFRLDVSVPGSNTATGQDITLSGSNATGLVGDILAAALPNVVAAVESSGAISISHLAGGTIQITEMIGTPLRTAGITFADTIGTTINNVQRLDSDVFLASPFVPLIYTNSTTAPYSSPADGTLWYYNTALEVDIMINSPIDGGWTGYQNVQNDARGYDLRNCDPAGPILSASQPTTQNAGGQLVAGDLWIDTGDLENYPMIYRYNGTVWQLIDNADQESVDGIIFADARWAPNDSTNPVTDDIPSIESLLSGAGADHLDPDAPDYRLYARGTLLFNTRRSGYTVKQYQSQEFANVDSPPTVVSTWVTHSGKDENGVPYFGHKAQRSVVVTAMKSAIESSTALREEQVEFNLIVCPGYPELMQNMITLNNDRKQTAFIIGDTPLDLPTSRIEEYITNTNLAFDNGENGLVSHSEYLGVYYPSGLGTDLAGESVVVPPSHMMLRTMIRSDNVSYPWFAPAGVRRGLIDNASSIGYIDTNDGNLFKSIGVTVGLRDVLYTSNVNPLTVLPGVGLVAYGQKTRASMTSAMDRINVARLICYLRLVFDKVARPFIFEPNDTITRNQVKSGFEAVLNDIVAKRGIYDYLVVCDTTNNTPDRIDRNELYVDIAIKPVKAIEFIYVPIRLINTGAPLSIT